MARAAALLATFLLGTPGEVAAADDAATSQPPGSHWVPVSEAFSNGEVREELFDDRELQQVRSWLRTPEKDLSAEAQAAAKERSDDCDVLIVTSAGIKSTDPEQALQDSSIVVIGTVTAVEPGLHHGRLASLVTVEVDRWLKAELSTPRPVTTYFIYPEARTTIDGTRYCQRGSRADRLAVGRGVFLGADIVLAQDPLVLYPLTRNVFFETPDRGVSAEGPIRGEAPQSWGAFEYRLMRLTETKEGRDEG